jgi:hypothetical protein
MVISGRVEFGYRGSFSVAGWSKLVILIDSVASYWRILVVVPRRWVNIHPPGDTSQALIRLSTRQSF